jgi:DNA-binding Lrp family transcriptional regulator
VCDASPQSQQRAGGALGPLAVDASSRASRYDSSQSRDEEVVVAVRAYVLIQTEVGKAASVATKVAEIQGVITADDVTGPYDVIVQAEADSVDDLGKMVVSRVQLIEGITRTLTCPVVHL